jgi:modulator of FtsH protease
MENIRTYPQTAASEIGQAQQRVLRNTYALLALSMAPTVAGALIGVQLNFSFLAGSPFIAFMLFLGHRLGLHVGHRERTRTAVSALPCCSALPSSWA